MTNVNLYPGPLMREKETELLAGQIVIDSDGTVASENIEGVSAVARTAEGKLKVSLEDKYAGGLLAADLKITGPFSVNRETDSSSGSDPHVDIETRDAAQPEGLLAGAPTTPSAQTTGAAETAWRVDLAAGLVAVGGVKKEFAAEADRVLHDTTELVENGESAVAAIVAELEAGAVALINVKGAAATTGTQVAPTDAEIEAALSTAGNPWVKICECTVNRTGDTSLTQTQDNTKRPLVGELADADHQTIDVKLLLQRRP